LPSSGAVRGWSIAWTTFSMKAQAPPVDCAVTNVNAIDLRAARVA
jgi:hypothetical protein